MLCAQKSEIGCQDARLSNSYCGRSVETVVGCAERAVLSRCIDTYHVVVGMNGEVEGSAAVDSEVVYRVTGYN